MTINWGLIGCGRIANNRVIPEGILNAKNSNLIGVSDIIEDRAKYTSKKFNTKKFNNNKELFEDKSIDAVYIATPPSSHSEIAISAANSGKNILTQKPIGLDAKQALGMLEACKNNDVKLGVGYMMRFHGAHQKIRSLIKEGIIGKPLGIRIRYSVWSPPTNMENEVDEYGSWIHEPKISGGGPMMDMGVHAIDLMLMFLGKIKTVASFCDTLLHDYAVEDTATCLFKFENGAQGILETYMSVPNFNGRRIIEIYGSEAILVAENTIFQLPSGDLFLYKKKNNGFENSTPEIISYEQDNMYLKEIELFSDAIINNNNPPIDGSDGYHVQSVVDAVFKSSRQKQYIEIT